MLRLFRKEFMVWEEYKAKIDFLQLFLWQQRIRKDNLKNL